MAYAQTKAQITTFRLVTRYTTLNACRNLPEEIISMIASNVRDAIFKQLIKEWIGIGRCLANTCAIRSHISQADRQCFFARVASGMIYDMSLEEYFEDSREVEHKEAVERYCKALTDLNGTGEIAKGVKVHTHHYIVLHSPLTFYRLSLKTLASALTFGF